jgi:hypothetical protein
MDFAARRGEGTNYPLLSGNPEQSLYPVIPAKAGTQDLTTRKNPAAHVLASKRSKTLCLGGYRRI